MVYRYKFHQTSITSFGGYDHLWPEIRKIMEHLAYPRSYVSPPSIQNRCLGVTYLHPMTCAATRASLDDVAVAAGSMEAGNPNGTHTSWWRGP